MFIFADNLNLLVGELRRPSAIRQVRLLKVIRWRFYREKPEMRSGRRQADAMNEARRAKRHGRDVEPKSDLTLVEWLCPLLGKKPTAVKNLLTRATHIRSRVLCNLERMSEDQEIRAVGQLLDLLAKRLRKEPELDWRPLVDRHIQGAPMPIPKGVDMGGLFQRGGIVQRSNPDFQLVQSDCRLEMEALAAQGCKFDAIVTDPPYGQGRSDIPDDLNGSLWSVPLFKNLVRPGGVICIWTGEGQSERWIRRCLDEGLGVSGLVLWDKGTGRTHHTDKELMLVCGIRPFAPITLTYKTISSGAVERLVHGTPKPVEMMIEVLERFTRTGDSILDPFAGTGPLGSAAIRAGRTYFGMEIDPDVMSWASMKLVDDWEAARGIRAATERERRVRAEARATKERSLMERIVSKRAALSA